MSSLRIGVVGATGALGSEMLSVLTESSLPIEEIVPIATEASLGHEIEFAETSVPVETGSPALRGLDLLFLCAPVDVSLEFARQALHAEVRCIDAAGALSASPEMPLRVGAFGALDPAGDTPLLVAPTGRALAMALVLRPLAQAAGLASVSGALLEGASRVGRRGIEALYQESIALFNQSDLPEPAAFEAPVAFDCVASLGDVDASGGSLEEAALAGALARLLEPAPRVALSVVQVPIFVGLGAALCVETATALDPKRAAECLAAAPGIDLWPDPADAPSVRAAAGRDRVLVGRVRSDPTRDRGLLLWAAADVLRLSAANAAQLAVRWLGLHH